MLRRKMLRDLKENKLAYIACLVVITIGLVIYTSISIVIVNLNTAKDQFYSECQFGDGFARIKGMPYSKIKDLKQIEGIDKVQGRLVKDVHVLFPNKKENVYLRLVSIDLGVINRLNDIKLIHGTHLEENKRNILIGPKFFEANNLSYGQQIPVMILGKEVDLRIVGTAQSPEFIYAMQDPQLLFPSWDTFDIAYMDYKMMQSLFNQQGIVNDVSFTLKKGYTFEDVKEPLKKELKAYGLEGIIGRKDQISNVILTEELKQLENTAQSIPVLLLMISSTILYIMLKRLVEQQRGQIGTLKAFGYTKREITYHYLSYAWVIGLLGGILGGLLGTALSFPFTEMYQLFFNFPNLKSSFSLRYFFIGIFLSIVFSLFAGFQGSRKVLALQPAEAMRPPAPVFGKKVLIERFKLIWNSLTVQGRMAMRNIARNTGRSLFTFIGIMFTFSMMATLWSFQDLIDVMVRDQFTKVQTYDARIKFASTILEHEVKRELHHNDGVKRLETMVEVPVTLKNQHLKKETAILGLEGDSQLYNILDKKGHKVDIPKSGVLLSEHIAKELHVRVGDILRLESPWLKKDHVPVRVTGIIPQYLGSNGYMELSTLQQLLGQGKVVTAALLQMDKEYIDNLKERYKASKNILTIEETHQSMEKFDELVGSFAYMLWIMVIMAVVTGFAIVYNSSIISLSERQRELASLRVLGMSCNEVLEVLSTEQWFIGFLAMVAGIPLTYMLKQGLAQSMNNDLYSMPVETSTSTFILAFAGTCVSIWIAQRSVMRKIKVLKIVDVLKERE